MANILFIDGMTIAMSIKASGLPSAHCQHKDSRAIWECPRCSYKIDNSNWPGLPAGFKFDPSDGELLQLLAAKCGVGNEKQNPYIDIFIPTIDADRGICYKLPENLPGARKDGKSFHLFHRIKNAYATGQRKCRMIYQESTSTNNVYRWHQTGMAIPITNNKAPSLSGNKMIFVLHESITGVSKSRNLGWVRHEIHLGRAEDEIEGALVVSKIFYQPKSPKSPMPEDVSGAHVLQTPAEAQTGDNVNRPNGEAKAVDSDAILHSSIGQDSVQSNISTNFAAEASIYTTIETLDFLGLDLQNAGDFSELLYMLEN